MHYDALHGILLASCAEQVVAVGNRPLEAAAAEQPPCGVRWVDRRLPVTSAHCGIGAGQRGCNDRLMIVEDGVGSAAGPGHRQYCSAGARLNSERVTTLRPRMLTPCVLSRLPPSSRLPDGSSCPGEACLRKEAVPAASAVAATLVCLCRNFPPLHASRYTKNPAQGSGGGVV